MKHTVKLVIKYILYGISWGCTCFVFMCLALFAAGGADLLSPIVNDFLRQSIGAIIVGIACGSAAIVYQLPRISGLVKTLIHFCIGMGVFYPVALYLGWIPFHPDQISYTVLQFIISCGIFLGIWFCFYLFNRNEAKKINERLKELEHLNTEK